MAESALNPEELGRFYQAALTAGAILSGFIGTFLSFRIQREANYYRQPFIYLDNDTHKPKSTSVNVELSQVPSSLLLIILGAACSLFFGVFCPLAALAHWGRFTLHAGTILAGIAASVVLVAAYFLNELTHYEILKLSRFKKDVAKWSTVDWILVVGGILLAGLVAIIAFCAVNGL